MQQTFGDGGAELASVSAGAVAVGAVAFELSAAGLRGLGGKQGGQDHKAAQ